jgi:acyl-CoA oxidase
MLDSDEEFRETLRKLSGEEIFQHREGLDYNERCALTYERLRVVGQRLPPGSALLRDPARLFTLLEWAAVADPPVFLALTLHLCLSLGAVVEFRGNDGAADTFVRELDTMASFGSLLVTEAGKGNSHLGIRTQADYDPASEEFVLHTPDVAARKFMPNLGLQGVPKVGVVYARLRSLGRDHGVFPFVMSLRATHGLVPGVRVIPLPEAPFLPLDYAAVEFDRCRLPRTALLTDDTTFGADGALHDPLADPGRRLRRSLDIRHTAWVASAAALAAVSRAGVTNALRYAGDRTTVSSFTSERPVLDHRAHQRPLFGALAACHALTCLVDQVKAARTAWLTGEPAAFDDPAWRPGPALNRTCGVVKALASRVTERIMAECGRRAGAHGMFAPARWSTYQGLAHMLGPAAGDSYLIVLETARTMAAGDDYVAPAAGITQPSRREVLDRDLWLGLLRTRERLLHQQLTAQLRLARRRGQSGYDAWNNRSLLGRQLVDAHGARLMLESTVGFLDVHGTDAALALSGLHALSELSAHADWYLCEGLLSVDQVRRIPAACDELCDRLRPRLESALAALDVPPAPYWSLTTPAESVELRTY